MTNDDKRYKLTIIQQPQQAKARITGDPERRPLEPCPIVQLELTNTNDHQRELFSNTFVLHAVVYDSTGQLNRSLYLPDDSVDKSSLQSNVFGTTVSNSYYVKDMENRWGFFFCFPNIQIEQPGEYKLLLSLTALPTEEEGVGGVLEQVWSDSFTVYAGNEFPGAMESSELSKSFKNQGVSIIPIRNKNRQK